MRSAGGRECRLIGTRVGLAVVQLQSRYVDADTALFTLYAMWMCHCDRVVVD